MSTKPTSGIHGDGRRRASSRGSSTSQQPTQRRGNRRVVKAEPLRLPSLRLPPVGAWLRAVIGPARGRLLRGALVLGGAAALAVGLELGWRALTTSPMFALDEISVVGNTRAPEAELRALAAVELGDNAIALSTDDVAKALALRRPAHRGLRAQGRARGRRTDLRAARQLLPQHGRRDCRRRLRARRARPA